MIANRIKKLSFSPTMQVAAKAKELKAKGENVIDLCVGEPDFNTPENIKNAAIKAINDNKTRYTVNPGIFELRQAISNKFLTQNNLNYSPENIIVSCGAKHSLFNAIQAVVNEGDDVILPAPYYVSYPDMIFIAGGIPIVIPTDESTEFKVTKELLEKYYTPKTKLFILCSPSNPTGAVYTKEELQIIADFCVKKNILVLSDEIYEELIFDNKEFISIASLNDEINRLTITVNGVSKTYAMTGWRIGYSACTNKEIIKAIDIYQSHSTSAAASISQYASLEAINGDQFSVAMMVKDFENRKNYFVSELNKIEGISCFNSNGAFYTFVNIKELINCGRFKSSSEFAFKLIESEKVAVVPGSAFGTEGYVRMAFATSMNVLENAIHRLKKFLRH